jgi:formylglycine-generating enzyme required for sulfatase activity
MDGERPAVELPDGEAIDGRAADVQGPDRYMSKGQSHGSPAPLVNGGSFARGDDPAQPATVSSFRLDKYEVTVARFRPFVDAVAAGWVPAAGAGKHSHLNGGLGLVTSAGTYEPGWDPSWTSTLPFTRPDWDMSLACDTPYHPSETWTPNPGPNEQRPLDCLTWLNAMAFCIWDGGFLPSRAEWEYAAAGGAEQRSYPWGAGMPTVSLAISDCHYHDPTWTRPDCSIAPVGSAPLGDGKWGQSDLAGNVWEWALDSYGAASPRCADCTTTVTIAGPHVLSGGSFYDGSTYLVTTYVGSDNPARPTYPYGVRCARAP